MATRIIEYADKVRRDTYPVVPANPLVEQSPITATGTSAQSAAFDQRALTICVQSDEAVYVKFGTNPTAATSSYRLQAGAEQFFDLTDSVGKASYKVAVRT